MLYVHGVVDMKIGQAVRRARVAQGLSQGQLARKLEMDQGHLSKFERGKTGVSSHTLERIFDILKLRVCGDPSEALAA